MNPQHFLFCVSNDCLKFHPENNSHDFIVELPQTLHLEGGVGVGMRLGGII